MSRPPKPLEMHELEGTYRKDRHGDSAHRFRPEGFAVKPADLSGPAGELWDDLVSELNTSGVAHRVDSVALAEMCRWYARYRRAADVMDRTEPDDAMAYRITQQSLMCWKAFDSKASEFGLSPVARMRLRVQSSADEESDKPRVRSRKRG